MTSAIPTAFCYSPIIVTILNAPRCPWVLRCVGQWLVSGKANTIYNHPTLVSLYPGPPHDIVPWDCLRNLNEYLTGFRFLLTLQKLHVSAYGHTAKGLGIIIIIQNDIVFKNGCNDLGLGCAVACCVTTVFLRRGKGALPFRSGKPNEIPIVPVQI